MCKTIWLTLPTFQQWSQNVYNSDQTAFWLPPHSLARETTPLHGFMEDLVTAVIAEVFITLSFCLKRLVKY